MGDRKVICPTKNQEDLFWKRWREKTERNWLMQDHMERSH